MSGIESNLRLITLRFSSILKYKFYSLSYSPTFYVLNKKKHHLSRYVQYITNTSGKSVSKTVD